MLKKVVFISFCLLIILSAKSQDSIVPENLGKPVNSEYSEISPIISPDGKTLYFVRCNHPKNTFGPEDSQDIWVSTLDTNEKWSEPEHMEAPLNTARYNGILSVTPDGNKILIKGTFKNGAFKGNGYSLCKKHRKKGWKDPEKLLIKKYSKLDAGLTYGGFLSNDGKSLLFYFSEEYLGENNDLYVSFLQKDKTWSQPLNLGNVINTPGNEISPYLASDGVTLYFSSDRKGSVGANDIYMSKRQDDTWQNWSEPVNLGDPINTTSWDTYYSVDAQGENAYLASEINSLGERDIIRIKLKAENKPDPVILIYGNVYNSKTKEPMEANIEYEILIDSTGFQGIASSDPTDGAYKITLPCGKNYGFNAGAEGFMSVSDHIDLSDINEYKEIRRDLYLVPFEVGQTVILNNVFFDHNKADLRSESFPELDRVVKFMNDNPTIEIEIGGHTDSDGSDDLNATLSDNRAKSVMQYITGKGVAKTRITSKGYGEDKPIASNDSEDGKQMNRRVEFTIQKK